MDKKSLLYASAGVVVLALLVGIISISIGGLNPQTRANLETAEQLLSSSLANYRKRVQGVRSSIDSNPALFQSKREQWLARLARSDQEMESASRELDQAKELAGQNDNELRVEIESRIGQVNQKRTQGLAGRHRDFGSGQDHQRDR